jgi:hypothetical protein
MTAALVASSSALALVANLPYLADIRRGSTRPRLATWLVWSILPAVASAAAFAAGQIPAAALSLCISLQCALVVALGYKHGDRTVDRLDVICLLGALMALSLWAVLRSPAIAVCLIVITDMFGAIPTVRHSWLRPHEETWLAFALSGLSGVLILFAADFAVLTAVVFPLYIAFADFLIAAILLLSPNRLHSPTHPSNHILS